MQVPTGHEVQALTHTPPQEPPARCKLSPSCTDTPGTARCAAGGRLCSATKSPGSWRCVVTDDTVTQDCRGREVRSPQTRLMLLPNDALSAYLHSGERSHSKPSDTQTCPPTLVPAPPRLSLSSTEG